MEAKKALMRAEDNYMEFKTRDTVEFLNQFNNNLFLVIISWS